MNTNSPAVFNFSPSFSVRIVMRNGDPWFVSKDIAEALDYAWTGTQRIQHVPEEWRGVTSVVTPSGEQQMAVLSEQGVYFFLGRSDKPKALPFQKWLAGEVLPAIRKTGRYVAPQAVPVYEQISADDHKNMQRVIWMICRSLHWKSSWTFAVWYALRKVTGCVAPHRFEVRHLPLMATELRRILEITTALQEHYCAIEKEAIRRVVRNREEAAPFVAQMKAEEARWLNESKPWLAKLDTWHATDLDAVAYRQPPGGSDHSEYAEQYLTA